MVARVKEEEWFGWSLFALALLVIAVILLYAR
jgi:hypothetical protein